MSTFLKLKASTLFTLKIKLPATKTISTNLRTLKHPGVARGLVVEHLD